jgi:hypothetical protein
MLVLHVLYSLDVLYSMALLYASQPIVDKYTHCRTRSTLTTCRITQHARIIPVSYIGLVWLSPLKRQYKYPKPANGTVLLILSQANLVPLMNLVVPHKEPKQGTYRRQLYTNYIDLYTILYLPTNYTKTLTLIPLELSYMTDIYVN